MLGSQDSVSQMAQWWQQNKLIQSSNLWCQIQSGTNKNTSQLPNSPNSVQSIHFSRHGNVILATTSPDVLSRHSSLSLPKGLHLKLSPRTNDQNLGDQLSPEWWVAATKWEDICAHQMETLVFFMAILLFFLMSDMRPALDPCVEPAAIAISQRQGRWNRLGLVRWNVCGSAPIH